MRVRSARIAIRNLAVAATDSGLLAPELAAGIARAKSALLNAPDITTAQGAARVRHHRGAARAVRRGV